MQGVPYVTFINIWFHIGISPFKLNISPKTGLCTVGTNWKCKLRSFLWLSLIFTLMLCWLRLAMATSHHGNLNLTYFGIANVIGIGFTLSCLQTTLWTKSKDFENLVNYLRLYDRNVTQNGTKKEQRITMVLMVTAFTSTMTMVYIRMFEEARWTWNDFEGVFKKWTKFMFFLSGNSRDFSIFIRMTLGFLTFTGFTLNYVLNSGTITILVMSARTVYIYLKKVEVSLRTLSPPEVILTQSRFATLIELHNKATGLIGCGLIFGYIPLVVYVLPDLIQPKYIVASLEALTYCSSPVACLIFTAWFTHKANAIFEQTLYPRQFLSGKAHLTVFLHGLEHSRVGLRATESITLDGGFLAGFSTFVVTLTVVIMEYQTQKETAY